MMVMVIGFVVMMMMMMNLIGLHDRIIDRVKYGDGDD
jgi:hypothetical protein